MVTSGIMKNVVDCPDEYPFSVGTGDDNIIETISYTLTNKEQEN